MHHHFTHRLIVCSLILLPVLAPSAAPAGTPQAVCSHLDVIFFDLGDTLIEFGIHLSDLPLSPRTDYTIASDDLSAIVQILEIHRSPVFCDGFESGDLEGW